MKKVIIGVSMMVVLTCAVAVWAADEAKEQKTATPVTPTEAQMRGRGPSATGAGGMQAAYEEMMKKREAEHQKGIAELEDIKKIAESEKATKTVEALQKMIDKKDAEFKKQMADAEKQRAEMLARMKQRQKKMEERNAGDKPVESANVQPDEAAKK